MRKGIFCLCLCGLSFVAMGGDPLPFAYVVNSATNSVLKIDTKTQQVVDTISLASTKDSAPRAIVTPVHGVVAYIGMEKGIAMLDLFTNEVTYAPLQKGGPLQLTHGAATLDGSKVYFVQEGGEGLVYIETATREVSQFRLGGQLQEIAIAPNGTGYVTDSGSSCIRVFTVSKNDLQPSIETGEVPYGIALTSDGKTGYFTLPACNQVGSFDAASGSLSETRISTGESPTSILITPDGTRAYTLNAREATLTSIQLASSLPETFAVGTAPGVSLAVTPDSATLYEMVTSGALYPIAVKESVPVPGAPIVVEEGLVGLAVTPILAPPRNFSVTPHVHKFLSFKECFNTLEWSAPEDKFLPVAAYMLYKDGAVLALLPARTYCFNDHDCAEGVRHTYAVASVGVTGYASHPTDTVTL